MHTTPTPKSTGPGACTTSQTTAPTAASPRTNSAWRPRAGPGRDATKIHGTSITAAARTSARDAGSHVLYKGFALPPLRLGGTNIRPSEFAGRTTHDSMGVACRYSGFI